MKKERSIAILGVGNIGSALAKGLLDSKFISPSSLTLTRRHPDKLSMFKERGCIVTDQNNEAIQSSQVIVLAVEPHHMEHVLSEISPLLTGQHTLISVATSWTINKIRNFVNEDVPIVRAMPNTAIAISESMTCLAGPTKHPAMEQTIEMFKCVGEIQIIDEELMTSATALTACGVAFFLRAIRAAAQGGIEIGFHADQAIEMAAQTAKGAAELLLQDHQHPEYEIDRVTTPKGCTIAGLNQLEHGGFSSAMIRGITTSAEKAADL